MKKKIAKIFCSFLVCVFALLCVGCTGNDSNFLENLRKQYEDGQISQEEYEQKYYEAQSVPLYGTKVLYRPEDYNWDKNVGEGNANYFGQYAYKILKQYADLYGFTRQTPLNYKKDENGNVVVNLLPDGLADPDTNFVDELPGWYDAIRYQIEKYENVTLNKITLELNGNGVTYSPNEDLTKTTTYFQVTADTQDHWNWNFGLSTQSEFIDESNLAQLSSVYLDIRDTNLFEDNQISWENNKGEKIEEDVTFAGLKYPSNTLFPSKNTNTIKNILLSESNLSSGDLSIQNYYNFETIISSYSDIYLGKDIDEGKLQDAEANFSQYVKALEYVLYCYNLDLEPNTMNVSFVTDSDGVSQKPVVTIAGYEDFEARGYSSNVDYALGDIKQVFSKVGSYVGITDKQKNKLKNWIYDNVVGDNTSSVFNIKVYDTQINMYVRLDADNNEILCDQTGQPLSEVDFLSSIATNSQSSLTTTIPVDRKYDTNIGQIVDLCIDQVLIGNENAEGEEPSGPHIDERYLASHVLDYPGMEFFISSDKGKEFSKIPMAEYQSMALMFRQDFNFSNISLHFYYDDMDEKGYAKNDSILINVYLNVFTDNKYGWRQVGITKDNVLYTKFQIEVKNGAFNYGGKNSTLELFGVNETHDGIVSGIKVGKFITDIGNGILQSCSTYNGLVDGTPLPLNGNDELRQYYQLKIPEEDSQNQTYTYGILNPAKFVGTGCDYFEIAFEVVKKPGDDKTNYKFKVGLGVVA